MSQDRQIRERGESATRSRSSTGSLQSRSHKIPQPHPFSILAQQLTHQNVPTHHGRKAARRPVQPRRRGARRLVVILRANHRGRPERHRGGDGRRPPDPVVRPAPRRDHERRDDSSVRPLPHVPRAARVGGDAEGRPPAPVPDGPGPREAAEEAGTCRTRFCFYLCKE
jgi:hypothetical protein